MEGWGISWRDGVGWVCDVGVGWAVNNFISQVRVSVFSSGKLLSTTFWIMWEKACFCL